MIKHKPVIECAGLIKSFREKVVLHDINIEINEGTIFALVGPNGAGKTTLLKILATLIVPSGGNARIYGNDLAKNPLEIRKMISFVSSEERSFYWRLTGRQNLKFFAALNNIYGKESERRIDFLLDAIGNKKENKLRFREYSAGMKQTLCIARGMLHDSPVLLMDEPTKSLSADAAKRVRKLLQNKSRIEGKTILISSHNLQEVEKLADIIAVMDNGTIKAMGTMDELKSEAGFSYSVDMDTIFEYFTKKECRN